MQGWEVWEERVQKGQRIYGQRGEKPGGQQVSGGGCYALPGITSQQCVCGKELPGEIAGG